MSIHAAASWLKGACAVLIGFGIVIALAALPGLATPIAFLVDLVFWPVDGMPTASGPEARLWRAICGGLLIGWGLMIWLIVSRLLPREPALARRLVLSGIGAWFVVDSLGSIAAGAPLNAALNVGFLLAFVAPLWRPVRSIPG